MSRLLFPILLLLCCTRCTPDQQELCLGAERAYVDLLYALQSEDLIASRTAATVFDERVRALRQVWYRPMSADGLDNLRYHIDLAECAYEDARESIEEGRLERAMVQLDRAVYQLGAGDRASLQELYIGDIYDFVADWLEIDYLFRNGGPSLDRASLAVCSRDAHRVWRAVGSHRPARALYFDRQVDERSFDLAHAALTVRVDAYHAALRANDLAAARELSNGVSEALWNLLLQFGTPEGGPVADLDM